MKEHVYFVYMLASRRNGTLLRAFLHENDMMAYLATMAVRLLEFHRVLKPTGSLMSR